MKIGLGTVQFGMRYGKIRREDQTSLGEVTRILRFAEARGIDVLDTAFGYGEAEAVLGQVLPARHSFRIVSKTPVFRKEKLQRSDGDALKKSFGESLSRMRQTSIHGLLVHHSEDLLAPGGEFLFDALRGLKAEGLVGKIGASVYTSAQLCALVERYEPDLLQFPINVLDQELFRDGLLKALKARGIELHARSVFLQGLLLSDAESLPPFFEPIRPVLARYERFLLAHGLSRAEGALGFVRGISEIDHVIVGVNRLEQLEDNLRAFEKQLPPMDFGDFQVRDRRLLNPAQWDWRVEGG